MHHVCCDCADTSLFSAGPDETRLSRRCHVTCLARRRHVFALVDISVPCSPVSLSSSNAPLLRTLDGVIDLVD